jgi:hypothetical protein
MLKKKIINKRERYGLTKLGWIIFLFTMIFLLIICLHFLHPFLALSTRVDGDIMVVEGWLPDYALQKAVDDFQHGSYKFLVTTGGPLVQGSYLSEYGTVAEFAAATITKIGFDTNKLVPIPTPAVDRDRTYASAIELNKWLDSANMNIESLDIYSFGPHARRSWLLFQYVFDPDIAVGIVAVENRSYDSRKWWKTSSGVRTVMSEVIAYFYARFIFNPLELED